MAEEFLYHYCSTQAAFSILQSRTIRLSPLSAANDTLEGRVLGRVFFNILRENGIPKGLAEVASVLAEGYAESTEGFAFCLSEDGDLLSQWRAYARDGTGISIGFSKEGLIRNYGPVSFGPSFYDLFRVDYGEASLRDTLAPYGSRIKAEFANKGDFISLRNALSKDQALRRFGDRQADVSGLFHSDHPDSESLLYRLVTIIAPLHFRIYRTKPISFSEEREWRLVRHRSKMHFPEIDYCLSGDTIKPFIPCLIADPAKEAIVSLILGPKHRSDINWLRAFLERCGLEHVNVTFSAHESYR